MIIKIEILMFLCFITFFFLFPKKRSLKTNKKHGYLSSQKHVVFFGGNGDANKGQITRQCAKKNRYRLLVGNIRYQKYEFISEQILSILKSTRVWSISGKGLVLPLSRNFTNFPLKFSAVVAVSDDIILGFIIVTPWFLEQTPLFIVDHLFVFPEYRNSGIADSLILEAASPLLEFGGLGIFSTSFIFNNVSETNKISTLYWHKTKLCLKKAIKFNFRHIYDINTLFNYFSQYSYMTNHPLFSHNQHKLTKDYFSYFFSKNGFAFYDEDEKTTIGFYIVKDESGDTVAQFAFRWNDSEGHLSSCIHTIYKEICDIIISGSCIYCENIILPFFQKDICGSLKKKFKSPLLVWDISYVYFYPKIAQKVYFSEQHVLGWFLPR
jgi:hypothetical protein